MDKTSELNLRIAALETTVRQLQQTNAKQREIIEEFKAKEQSISNAIIASMEHANQLEQSRKKLYSLDIQRSRLMYLRMEQIVNELYARYPELKQDMKLKDMSEKFKNLVYEGLKEKDIDVNFELKNQQLADDPIKKLLHNIIQAMDSKKVENMELKGAAPNFGVNANKSSSGFDINEALHPTMPLDEILKAFDLGKKDDKK
mgnify:CR=1 FL=1